MEPSLDAILGPDGLLARRLPGYESRPSQAAMSRAVERALEEGTPLDAEAPCGTGKTFAYLVPLIRHCLERETRAVVVTANIALQEQLSGKDLPFLARHLPWPFRFALIKGIQNYLCLDRYFDTAQDIQQGRLFGADRVARDLERIARWFERTKTGDRSELDFEPRREAWGKICGVNDLCNGRQCGYAPDCFALKARARLEEAHVIVTNYHLFLAHLAIRDRAEVEAILPEHDFVVCDEGHEMADIARQFFGLRLTSRSVLNLFRGARAMKQDNLIERLRTASDALFLEATEVTAGRPYATRVPAGRFVQVPLLLDALGLYAGAARAAKRQVEEERVRDLLAKSLAAAEQYQATLKAFHEQSDANLVYYVERDGEGAAVLEAQVLEVAPVLDRALYGRTRCVVTTSATLAAGGSFAFLKSERGGAQAQERVFDTPFDFAGQCRIVIPEMRAADPNDPGFAAEMAEVLNRVLRQLDGRTMALFTSYRNLEACAERARETGLEILRQGDRPRTRLLEEFRRRGRGCALFGTASFWHGVDIPGEALTCLAIDRIPFDPPDLPLLEALRERRQDLFDAVQLPRAILALRQGFGRLIRTKTDRGFVVLFDPRLLSRPYGRKVLASLPACPVTRDLGEAFAFVGGAAWPTSESSSPAASGGSAARRYRPAAGSGTRSSRSSSTSTRRRRRSRTSR